MLRVWGRTNSVNVQKVLWALAELELDYERIDAGLAFGKNHEPAFLAMNPNGLVPTIDDDGFVLWESNTIVRYLAAKHDAGGLWPTDPRARASAEKWMDWQLSKLAGAVGPMFLQLIRTPPDQCDSKIVARGQEACLALFELLNQALEDRLFLAGERLTIGDIPAGALAHRWYALPVDHGNYLHVRRWYEALTERPGFRAHVMLPLS